jgi:hypothetical protein
MLDLRDSRGTITLKDGNDEDGEAPTIRISAEGDQTPFVLKEGDTFRVRMPGGTIALPPGLPVEVSVPPQVQLRVERSARDGGETVIRPIQPEPVGARDAGSAGSTAGAASGEASGAEPQDLNEFARVMSERAQRIFAEMTEAVRASNTGFADEIARRLDQAAVRIDEQTRHVAQRVQHEVERVNEAVSHAQRQARHAAERAEVRAHRVRERMEQRAARHSAREERREVRRVGRGPGWFANRLEEWAAANTARQSESSPRAAESSAEERRAILAMLSEGKITSEQAAKLLDALG